MNFGFIIDNRKCIGCHACTVACKAEHDVPIGVNRTWVKYIEKGEFPSTRRMFSVMRCNHCDEAPCVEICPTAALYTRSDGIVDFDNRRCIGCKACMQACPYDALYIDPESQTAAKCNYCAHRVDIGLEPACVIVCPEHAIISGDMDDPDSEIAQLLARQQVAARKVEKGTQPKLFYIDGDHAALHPGATEPSDSYMWSSQSTGVGHFAKYAESRLAQTRQKEARDGYWIGNEQDRTDEVLVPESQGADDAKMLQKALDVIKEKARRVYDAPAKGVLWGWEVAAYIWTKAVATGAFLILFLAITFDFAPVAPTLQWTGLALALLFLTLTGGLLIKDLDQPRRFAYVLLRPQWRSWLVRGGYAIAVYGALLAMWGLASYFHWTGLGKVTFRGSALFAAITAAYTALLFAQAKGRDFWQSPLLLLHMLVHAFLAGAAVFGITTLFVAGSDSWQHYLRIVLYVSIGMNLLVMAAEFLTPHATADAKRAARMMVSGRFSTLFWVAVVVFGNIIPLALIWIGGMPLLVLASLLILHGIYFTEHIWVRAPQLIQLS